MSLLFSDDFGSGLGEWTQRSGTWTNPSNQLEHTTGTGTDPCCAHMDGSTYIGSIADYEVTATVVTGGSAAGGGGWVGLWGRRVDYSTLDSDGYTIVLSGGASGIAALYARESGSWDQIDSVSFNWSGSTSYDLLLGIDGDDVYGDVDGGSLALAVTDAGRLDDAGDAGISENTGSGSDVSVGALWDDFAVNDFATGATLTVQEAAHGHTADNVGLTQQNILTIADAAHGHTADNLGLTQQNILVVAEALHSHLAGNVALVQQNVLAIQEALHAHAAGNIDLLQANVLAVDEALHGHLADNVTLDVSVILTVQDALHAQAADAPGLVQANILAVAGALQAHLAQNVDLLQANVLAVDEATHGQLAENLILLIGGTLLTVQESTHGQLAENVDLLQANVLAVADALHSHLAGQIRLELPGIVTRPGRLAAGAPIVRNVRGPEPNRAFRGTRPVRISRGAPEGDR